MDIESAQRKAQVYAEVQGRSLQMTLLGFGQDGYLWTTEQNTAIKVLERKINYDRELECYPRLLSREITRIGIFDVPRLIGFSEELQIVEMSVVSPPHLLDFGKAHLDVRPDFSPETLAEWKESLVELFGDRAAEVRSALRVLETLGIYYLDAKPGNITF